MPLYDFLNTETNEVFEKRMSINDLEQYLKDNPHLRSYFGPAMSNIPLIDPVRLGVRKIDGGFREVLSKINEKTAGSRLKDTSWF